MTLSLTTSLSSMKAIEQVRLTTQKVERSISRLSSGTRVRSSKDDASGLAIANKLSLENASLRAAQRNAAQAGSMLQIADGAMNEMVEVAQRMRTLAAAAQSDNISATERNFLDTEFQQLKGELNRIAAGTQFNGQEVLASVPDWRLGALGGDIDSGAGIVGYTFDDDMPRVQNGDGYTIDYNSTTGVMTVQSARTSLVQSVNLSAVTIPAGELRNVDFHKLGITLTLNSDFDFAADIDSTVADATFTVNENTITPSTFVPSDISNLIMHLSAEDSALNVSGGLVQSVGDIEGAAGGSNDATQGTLARRPLLTSGQVFGKQAFRFDGVDDFLGVADHPAINLSSHNQKSMAVSFRTGSDVTSLQNIYEEGAQVNGMNMYVSNGQLHYGIWRSNGGVSSFHSANISTDTEYTASLDFDAASNTFTAYLNGVQVGTGNALGAGNALPSHSGDIGIGQVNQRMRLHTGGTAPANGANFQGHVGEIIYYNNSMAATDHQSLDAYLRDNGSSQLVRRNEELSFKIDSQDGKNGQISYKLAATDVFLERFDGIDITSRSNATVAGQEVERFVQSIGTEQARLGATLSRLGFAANNTAIKLENTLSARSTIIDTDIASEITSLASNRVLQSAGVSMVAQANSTQRALLNLLR